jgi:hypothetical protein
MCQKFFINLLLIASIPGEVLIFAFSNARSNSNSVKSRSKYSRSSSFILLSITDGWSATSPRKLLIDCGVTVSGSFL